MCLTWLILHGACLLKELSVILSDELETHITDIICYMYICSFISPHNITRFYFQLRQDVKRILSEGNHSASWWRPVDTKLSWDGTQWMAARFGTTCAANT